jgi:hypothetical protein
MLHVVDFQMAGFTVGSMCLHDMIAHIKGEEAHVHYEWEAHAFDVLYGGFGALWSDGKPRRRGTIIVMCASLATWLLLLVLCGAFSSLPEYTSTGSPEILVIVLSLMPLMVAISSGGCLPDGNGDRDYVLRDQGALCGHHNGSLRF